MSSERNTVYPDRDNYDLEEGQGPSVKDILLLTLKHWPWLVLSVVLCLGAGVWIILATPKTFTENAQMVLKNEQEGGSAAISSQFSDLGLFSNNANVMNEIATISSPDVTEDVVKMLKLNVEYFAPGPFHKKVLYGRNLPIDITFPDIDDQQAVKFHLEFGKGGKYTLTKLKYYDKEDKKWHKIHKTYNGTLGNPLKTDIGTMIVARTGEVPIEEGDEIEVNKRQLSTAVNYYNRKVKVTLQDDDSTVIDLTITDPSIQRADEILAAVIAVYNDNWIKEKNQVAVSTSDFINERLGVIETELGHVDSDISEYKSANLIPDVVTVTTSYVREKEELSKLLIDLKTQLQAVKLLGTRLAEGGNSVIPANTVLDNSALAAQIKDYNELILTRNTLLTKSSEQNPLVKNLDGEIAQMREAITGAVATSVQSLENQIRVLDEAMAGNTGKIASNPAQAKYLLSVERQQKVKEDLYLFLLQKREDNELNQAFTAYNTRIIKRPGGDGNPTAPRKTMIMAAFFLLGLVIPFGYNYFYEKYDTKLRTRKDTEGMATPLMGEIPFDKQVNKHSGKKGEQPDIVMKAGTRDVINEAFRVLRSNLERTRINRDSCNVIALTSFNPGSGKSFITVNLGAALAMKQKRVLVIDGDFRRGSASEYVGSPSKGLADYLSGQTDKVESLILPCHGQEDLSILPMGKLPPNPTELIESPSFEAVVKSLRKDYDYILVDCPPIEVVADAQIIDAIADRTLFVLRAGLLERSLLRELDRFYKEKRFNHLAFILNGTQADKMAYGTSGRYGYGN